MGFWVAGGEWRSPPLSTPMSVHKRFHGVPAGSLRRRGPRAIYQRATPSRWACQALTRYRLRGLASGREKVKTGEKGKREESTTHTSKTPRVALSSLSLSLSSALPSFLSLSCFSVLTRAT